MRHKNIEMLGLYAGIVLALGGCNMWDSSADTTGGSGDTGGTGGDESGDDESGGVELPGHRVTCCFQGTFRHPSGSGGGNHAHYGCQSNWTVQECLDPNAYGTTPQDLVGFCQKKCEGPWPSSSPQIPPWTWYDNGDPDVPNAPPTGSGFLGCLAMPIGSAPLSHIKPGDYNQCQPFEPKSYGEFADVPPDFETVFTSSSPSSELDVWITGDQISIGSWEFEVNYSIHQCEEDGADILCRVLISSLELSVGGAVTVGDYRVGPIMLALNELVAADIVFTPHGRDGYIGTFELSEAEGNPIGSNLFWTQLNTQTSSEDEGALHLTNGPGGLGGVDEIHGVIELGAQGSSLRLIGYGEDAFGGEWASVDFDVLGAVQPIRGRSMSQTLGL